MHKSRSSLIALTLLASLLVPRCMLAEVIWTEGEKPVKANVTRHPWWYDKIKKDQLSSGDFISNWGDKPGTAEYSITAAKADDYDFWVHANPVGTKLSFQLNQSPATEIDLSKDQRENVNIAADGAIDLRFMAWEHVGKITLRKGENTIVFRMHSDNNNHGMLDCFVLGNEAFQPYGLRKPGEKTETAESDQGWIAFEPGEDHFTAGSGFDLRALNENQAGDEGFITACYGALQDSNAFIFFALDTDHCGVKPGYFMQPWTLMSPACMGQYPAAAFIFRQRLISPGDVLVSLNLRISDLENLQGTPMPQDASFDELRLKDVPTGTDLKAQGVIDPLVHYAGRTNVTFSAVGGQPKLVDLAPFIDHSARTVSATNHQLKLDYGKGVLIIDAPGAQGMSGNLKAESILNTRDLSIQSDMELAHVVAVAMDGQPIATSKKILLQVMSEERTSGFQTEDAGNGKRRMTDIGHDPWLIKPLTGTVKFKRADAAALKITPLDLNGYPKTQLGNASNIRLQAGTVYYLISG